MSGKGYLISAILCLILLVVPLLSPNAFSSHFPISTDLSPTRSFDRDGDLIDDSIDWTDAPVRTFIHLEKGDVDRDLAAARIASAGADVRFVYEVVPVLSAIVHDRKEALLIVDIPGVNVIEKQRELPVYLDISAKAVRAARSDVYSQQNARNLGYAGDGITIAIIDSGVDNEHPSLEGSFVAGADFTNPAAPTDGTFDPDDRNGHGTGLASIALGRGVDGEYEGVAPAAGLIDLRVFIYPTPLTQAAENLVTALDWCYQNQDTGWGVGGYSGVDVISLSMGLGPEGGAIAEAVNTLSLSGVVVVAAAGNSGGQAGGDENAYWPDGAIIVGGIDDMNTVDREDDLIWSRSTYGPRPSDGDSDPLDELRPDLVAPAVEISVASFSLTSNVQGASGWSQGSGTSYASPHCSGVVALMLEANPAIIPTPLSNPVRKILHVSSEQMGDPYDDLVSPIYNERYGYGMLDAYDAASAARDHTGANGRPQILSFEIRPSTTTIGSICSVRVQAVDPDEDLLSYEISADGGSITGDGPEWEWSAPDEPGYYTLTVVVSDPSGSSDTSRSSVQVEEGIPNRPPLITSFESSRASLPAGESCTLTVTAMDADADPLTYSYSASDGAIEGEGSVVEYTAPGETGSVRITATVRDGRGGEDTEEITLDIRDVSEPVPPVINLASISPSVVEGGAGNVTLIITAKVEDDEGLEDIESVFVDLSPLGKGATTMMYDDGEGADSTRGDGVYTVEVTSLSGVEAGNYSITVTVIDLSGLTHSTALDLEFRSIGFDEVEMGKSVTVDPMFAILIITLLVVIAVIFLIYVRRRRKETVLRPVPPPQQELQYQNGLPDGYQQYDDQYAHPGIEYEHVDPQYLPQQPIFRPVQEQVGA